VDGDGLLEGGSVSGGSVLGVTCAGAVVTGVVVTGEVVGATAVAGAVVGVAGRGVRTCVATGDVAAGSGDVRAAGVVGAVTRLSCALGCPGCPVSAEVSAYAPPPRASKSSTPAATRVPRGRPWDARR
jgi:hypothetical protein